MMSRSNETPFKVLVSFIGVYLALLSLFTLSVVGIQLIPRSAIENNIKSSADVLKKDGIYPRRGYGEYNYLDTYTDALTFNMLYCAESEKPLDAGLLNYVYQDTLNYNQISVLDRVLKGEIGNMELYSYSRNWHGTQLINRPLLIITDINGMKLFYSVLMLVLVLAVSVLMWKRIAPAYTMIFVGMIGVADLFILPLCLQFNICFDVALLGMIALLIYPDLSKSMYKTSILFFIIGAVCNFFDWFTIPQLCFGFPFIVYAAMTDEKKMFKALMVMGVAWIAGYAGIMVSKWALGTLLTDYNCFDLALNTVGFRFSHSFEDVDFTFVRCLKKLMHPYSFTLLMILSVIFNIYLFLRNRELWMSSFKEKYYLLLLSLLTPAWILIIRNHSLIHYSLFVWRAMLISYFSVLLFTYYASCRVLKKKQNA